MQNNTINAQGQTALIPLFHDIANFLARGERHAKDSGLPEQVDVTDARYSLLPFTSLGRGERSSQFVLFSYLAASRKYFTVGEYPINSGSESADFLVSTNDAVPIAHIEGKHLSVHQAHMKGLLKSLDDDFVKHFNAKTGLPLIQYGLFTAIKSPRSTASAPVPFLDKYGKKEVNGPYGLNESTGSRQRFESAMDDVGKWLIANESRYSHWCYGWGPDECAPVPGGPRDGVLGRVGYVCVLTSGDALQRAARPPAEIFEEGLPDSVE